MKILVIALTLTAAYPSMALTIDEYMQQINEKNKTILSYNTAIEAAHDRQDVGDLSLSPLLTASYSHASDQSLPSQLGSRRDSETAALGLSKKFSTGTTIGFTAQTFQSELTNPLIPFPVDYSTGQLGLSLQQSLWKDFFGRATRMRQSRDSLTSQAEVYRHELGKRATLVQMESDYWDYLVAQEDYKLKKTNGERTRKLVSWTRNRVTNGISDRVDLYQIQALASLRDLELATAEEELEARAIKIRENLGLSAGEPVPVLSSNFSDSRPYIEELKRESKVVRIESYLTVLDSKIKGTLSQEVEDSSRPDLSVVGKYSTSSYDTDHQTMLNNIGKTDFPVTYLGVNFSWMFGSDAISGQRSSARKDAQAALYRAEQAQIESENAWKDHLRKYELAKMNVTRLEKISALQVERSKQEQSMFSRGRTITVNVVNAETDSAEAEVNYLRARSGLRKLEAATLLFIPIKE